MDALAYDIKNIALGDVEGSCAPWHWPLAGLSYAATVLVAAIASGFVPAIKLARPLGIEPLRIDWTFVPSPAATLALVLLTGLIAGNLWTDRVVWGTRWGAQLIDRALSSVSRFALAAVGFALAYIGFATSSADSGSTSSVSVRPAPTRCPPISARSGLRPA